MFTFWNPTKNYVEGRYVGNGSLNTTGSARDHTCGAGELFHLNEACPGGAGLVFPTTMTFDAVSQTASLTNSHVVGTARTQVRHFVRLGYGGAVVSVDTDGSGGQQVTANYAITNARVTPYATASADGDGTTTTIAIAGGGFVVGSHALRNTTSGDTYSDDVGLDEDYGGSAISQMGFYSRRFNDPVASYTVGHNGIGTWNAVATCYTSYKPKWSGA